MGMNATLLEKYGERRATVRSACITIVTCYKYAPFFAPKMALLKTTFFTKYLDLRGPKRWSAQRYYLCFRFAHCFTGIYIYISGLNFFHPLKHIGIGNYGELIIQSLSTKEEVIKRCVIN